MMAAKETMYLAAASFESKYGYFSLAVQTRKQYSIENVTTETISNVFRKLEYLSQIFENDESMTARTFNKMSNTIVMSNALLARSEPSFAFSTISKTLLRMRLMEAIIGDTFSFFLEYCIKPVGSKQMVSFCASHANRT